MHDESSFVIILNFLFTFLYHHYNLIFISHPSADCLLHGLHTFMHFIFPPSTLCVFLTVCLLLSEEVLVPWNRNEWKARRELLDQDDVSTPLTAGRSTAILFGTTTSFSTPQTHCSLQMLALISTSRLSIYLPTVSYFLHIWDYWFLFFSFFFPACFYTNSME